MAIEIEKKFKLTPSQFENMRQRLADSDAEYRGQSFECNRLFSNDEMRQKSAYIRIRNTDRKSTLTYKQNLSPVEALKRQIEFESEVGDPESVEQIIAGLGLKIVIRYEKERETWQLGGAEIVLDRLPFGHYMEIEGSVEDIESAESSIVSGDIAIEPSSYPQLTSELGTLDDGVAVSVFLPEARSRVNR